MAAVTNGETPAKPSLLQEAWEKAVEELGQGDHHEFDIEWLKNMKCPVDENPESTKKALRSVLGTIQATAKKRGIDRTPSGTIRAEGPLKKIQAAFRGMANALDTTAEAVMWVYGPVYAGLYHKMAAALEADDACLASLSDALADGLDRMMESSKVLDRTGEIESVREGVVRLHVTVLKFWACAARRIEDDKLAKLKRQTHAEYISRHAKELHGSLARNMKEIAAAVEDAEEKEKTMRKNRNTAKSKLKARDPTDPVDPGDPSTENKHADLQKEGWLPDTCQWITEDQRRECQQFLRWRDSNAANLLWIHGAAGVGKTTLAWYIIDKLLGNRATGSDKLFFYCTHELVSSHKATAGEVLRSLASQIFTRNWQDRPTTNERFKLADRIMSDAHGIPDAIMEFFPGDKDSFQWLSETQSPSASALGVFRNTLRRLLSALPGPVYIVIDGLDEYPDEQMRRLLQILRPLCTPPKSGADRPLAKLLVLSRPTAYLVEDHGAARDPGDRFDEFEPPDDGVRKDVRAFLDAGISAHLRTFHSLSNEEVGMHTRDFVVQLVPAERKTPPFQWASLVLKSMCGYSTLQRIKDWLAEAELGVKSLDKFYAGVLLRLESKLGDGMARFMRSIIVWATYGRKVFTTAELAELLKLQDTTITEEWVFANIKMYCGSLFRLQTVVNEHHHGVKRKITTLHFIHFSVADDCIAYLQTDAFGESLVSIRGNATVKAKIEEKYGFFSYTAMWWTYHLVRVDAAKDVGVCVKTLNGFFLHKGMKTWMEGILALNEGGEWLPTISAQIQNWLRTHGMWNGEDCRSFRAWVSDISSPGFRDYEQTLLHNNNEVHFVDERRLLPSIPAADSTTDVARDRLQALERASGLLDADGELMRLPPANHSTERLSITSPLLPHACLRHPIFVGEDADNRFGFFSLDRNRAIDQGLLTIDKMSNHPRLVWEKASMPQRYASPDAASSQSDNTRLTSVCSLLRDIDHSQFTALSAALSDDGTKLAALYREDCAGRAIKLRLILWTFDGDNLDDWRSAVHDLVLQLSSSVAALHQTVDAVRQQEQRVKRTAMSVSRQPPGQGGSAAWREDESDEDIMTPFEATAPSEAPAVNASADLQRTAVLASMQQDRKKTVSKNKDDLVKTMQDRVAVPSTGPLEQAKVWASVAEIVPLGGSKTAMQGTQQSAFASSPYLVAFWDPTTLVLPCGRLNITSDSALTEFPPGTLSDSDAALTIVPRGRFLLYSSEDGQGVEVVIIRPKAKRWVEKRHWSLSACQGAQDLSSLRFTRVVDCSDSGHRVAIEVDGLPQDQVGLVLLELHSLEGRVVFLHDGEGERFGISRVFFCPRDRHLLVVSELKPKSVGQPVYTLFMVDSHTAKVSVLGQTTKAPVAVAHFRCQGVGCAAQQGVDGQTSPSLMEQSISSSINLCVRDEIVSSEPIPMETPLYQCETTDRGIEECRVLRAEVGRDLAAVLGSEAIYDALASSSALATEESDGPSGDTAITAVFADRSAKLLSISSGDVAEGLDELPKTVEYVSATCKPSWVGDRVCAAYMSVALGDRGQNDGSHGSRKATLTVNSFSWALDLTKRVDTPLGAHSIPRELESVTETDLMCRGLSISRNTELLAFWLGSRLWFLDQRTESPTILPISLSTPKRSLSCLDVIFNQDDSFAAVLWSEPPAPGDARPRVRASLLELYDLTGVETGDEIVVCGALEVDCDARAVHFHPMPEEKRHLIVTTVNSLQLYEYGGGGLGLIRSLGEDEVKQKLTIPNKTYGPASPKPTAETTVDIPIDGLAPLHFSTCGQFAFSEGWNCFAWVKDLENPVSRLSGRRVVKTFTTEIQQLLQRFDCAAQEELDKHLLELRREGDNNPNSVYTTVEPRPQWTLPELHPRIMYENVLYASGQHRFKIFRIRTYLVLGWSAEGNNLFAHPVPKFTWYRRVLCAVPQSMSTWQATLIWATASNPEHYLAVVLFPPPGGDVRLPQVIHTPLKFVQLQVTNIKKNDDDDDGWLRGHASGCPYRLKAEKEADKDEKDINEPGKKGVAGGK